ncbi:MAG: PaaI family thioesterase, partial [Clostridiales bacterium]
RNITGAVQGGVFFTLADFCFAVAANAPHILEQTGRLIISLSNSITFIKQPRGNKLWAYAEQISAGHKVCSYRVKVTDEYQTAVAEMLVNGYTVTKQL